MFSLQSLILHLKLCIFVEVPRLSLETARKLRDELLSRKEAVWVKGGFKGYGWGNGAAPSPWSPSPLRAL